MSARSAGSRFREADGFSLLEVVVSVTLVALMAVALWSVFRIAVTSWSRGTADIDANQRNRSILDLVQKQVGSIYGALAPIDLLTGGAIYPIFWGARDSMQFVSLASLRFQENPGLTLVSYDLVPGRSGTYALQERERRFLGVDSARESFFERDDTSGTTIFDNLTSFAFEYLDPGAEDRPPRWVSEWNPRETGRLPSAVSLTMIAQEASGRSWSRHMVIPVLASPNDPRLAAVNPFENRPRRLREDDPRAR